jgi:hypothetical protein
MVEMKSIDELTVKLNFEEGDIRPLVEYLKRELKDKWAQDFIEQVLYGEIKKGDGRKNKSESQKVSVAFKVRRLCADFGEKNHGDAHVTNEVIYAQLDKELNYSDGTSERYVKRDKNERGIRK